MNHPNTSLSLDNLVSFQADNASQIAETSQIKVTKGGQLYTDSHKLSGILGTLTRPFVAWFRSSQTSATFKEANEKMATFIQNQYGDSAAEAFKAHFSDRLAVGKPITVGAVRLLVKKDPSLFQKKIPFDFDEADMSVLKARYDDQAESLSSLFKASFAKEGTTTGTTEEIKKAFLNTPLGPQKTVSIRSKEVMALSEMNLYVDPESHFDNSLIPVGGMVTVFGEKERGIMMDVVTNDITKKSNLAEVKEKFAFNLENNQEVLDSRKKELEDFQKNTSESSENFHTTLASLQERVEQASTTIKILQEETGNYENWSSDKLLAYSRAQAIDWQRSKLTIGGKLFVVDKGKERAPQIIQKFKNAIEKLSGSPPSDRQVFEMLSLLDQENLVGGFPQGSNPETGIGLGQEVKKDPQGNLLSNHRLNISLTPEGTFHFNFTAAEAYLGSITTPILSKEGKVELKFFCFSKDSEGKDIHRATNQNSAQFEIGITSIYSYTPSKNDSRGTMELKDSRQMFWPRNIHAEITAKDSSVSAETNLSDTETVVDGYSRSNSIDSTVTDPLNLA